MYVVVQQGGSSAELYAHFCSSMAEARADRRDCWREGAYKTSEPVRVSARLAKRLAKDHKLASDVWELLDDVFDALKSIEAPTEGLS